MGLFAFNRMRRAQQEQAEARPADADAQPTTDAPQEQAEARPAARRGRPPAAPQDTDKE